MRQTQTRDDRNAGRARKDPPRSMQPPSERDLTSAVAALAPLVAAHCDADQRDRRLAKPLVAALRASGLLRLWMPRELGGLEADPETVITLLESIAALDGSVGWNFLVGITHGSFGAYLTEEAARTIWGRDPDVIIASSFGPTGRAVVVDGGYRVTGRWSFASGIHQADWLCGGCVIADGDQPRSGSDENPERLLLFFRAEDAEILDTWHTGGLRGTGSQDFTVRDLFVPHGYGFDLLRTTGRVDGPLYRRPFLAEGNLHGVAFAAVALGIARHAIEAFVDLAGGKVPAGRSRTLLRDRPLAQLQVAQAEALVLAARAFLLDATRKAWASILEHGAASDLELARVRLALVHAGESSLRATEMMHRAGGSSAVYAKSALDRCLRDAHAASQHIQMNPEHYFTVGAILLGQSGARRETPPPSSP
ncbi:MAG TPA: hydroxylase [Chloroflexota bacterium]|nr:hydroxylase [Chloroflexota bacterium]